MVNFGTYGGPRPWLAGEPKYRNKGRRQYEDYRLPLAARAPPIESMLPSCHEYSETEPNPPRPVEI